MALQLLDTRICIYINSYYVLNDVLYVYVAKFSSIDDRALGVRPILETTYTGTIGIDAPYVSYNTINAYNILYEWLKTLPDFVDAINIVDVSEQQCVMAHIAEFE